jgi:long-subunit fatty acid transport protein
MISASVGLRFIDAKTEFDGGATLISTLGLAPRTNVPIAFKADATGLGGIIGLDIFPSDKLTIGLRYETPTRLEYEYDVSQGAAILSNLNITQGGKARDDLPGTLGTGVGYQFTDKLRGEVNLTYYFNTGSDIGGTTLREGLEEQANDGWEIGIGATYAFTETVKGSAGYLYTSIGVDPEDSSKFLPDLNSHALGFGVQWTVAKNLDLTFAAGNVFYVSDSYVDSSLVAAGIEATPTKVEYEKNIPYMGFGIQYKFF